MFLTMRSVSLAHIVDERELLLPCNFVTVDASRAGPTLQFKKHDMGAPLCPMISIYVGQWRPPDARQHLQEWMWPLWLPALTDVTRVRPDILRSPGWAVLERRDHPGIDTWQGSGVGGEAVVGSGGKGCIKRT